MKESISLHYPTAAEAAAEEQRLQLELALQFDLHEYRVGDQVTWQVPSDAFEGRGELIEIGRAIEIVGDDKQKRPMWEESLYVQIRIIESSILHQKRRNTNKVADAAVAVTDRYAPGRCIELKKNQVTGRIRKRVI